MPERLTYTIHLPQFEGPFDLLLFFIERDEIDIYDIPINKLIHDFLDYIHQMESLNIELASEFILFVSTLMRIKARMLLPRREVDASGQEIDPRQELVNKILEYKKYKQVAAEMAQREAEHQQQVRRGNVLRDLEQVGETMAEGTEVQTLTLFKLMKAYQKALIRLDQRLNKPQHVVMRYHYTMENSREFMVNLVSSHRTLPFATLFEHFENRMHAIFLFLAILELVQQGLIGLLTGEGYNNFILEYRPPVALPVETVSVN
ncbi:condensin subunit ScpA [Thermoflavifilum aggregans]|uniref:Segregation and condensation protein A n=1 Tax=Thermoflavifilum aggregans TaxID=454188 RepID=A0A2M9CSX0_9BACT|nr:segregation/condensation protein A [Thermoflavifilum aggregans]PJJ74997.1 condensin subunit ScpA [Thermoflavifilum aggregans]